MSRYTERASLGGGMLRPGTFRRHLFRHWLSPASSASSRRKDSPRPSVRPAVAHLTCSWGTAIKFPPPTSECPWTATRGRSPSLPPISTKTACPTWSADTLPPMGPVCSQSIAATWMLCGHTAKRFAMASRRHFIPMPESSRCPKPPTFWGRRFRCRRPLGHRGGAPWQ